MSKVFLVNLGCVKNLVDSEHILGLLQQEGYEMVDNPSDAEIAIVNTCAFIRSAVEESIDTILDLARLKGGGHPRYLLVAGCFVQRYGRKLLREIPEVDAWVGTGQILRIPETLRTAGVKAPVISI